MNGKLPNSCFELKEPVLLIIEKAACLRLELLIQHVFPKIMQ